MIHFAAHFKIVKYLVGLTDSPIAPDHYGWTPIHEAAKAGHLNIVKFLVHFTDTPNAPANDGMTPIEIAKTHGHNNIAKFLEEYRGRIWISKLRRMLKFF